VIDEFIDYDYTKPVQSHHFHATYFAGTKAVFTTSISDSVTAVLASGGRHRRARKPLDPQGLLPKVRGIADAGFLVVFANRRDAHHPWRWKLRKGSPNHC
jgi:hypothetical protein